MILINRLKILNCFFFRQDKFTIIEINENIFKEVNWKESLSINFWQDIECVFHVGACSDTLETNVNYMMTLNYEFTKHLTLLCKTKKTPLIYSSSAANYGINNEYPSNLYGWSKYVAEDFVISNDFSMTVKEFINRSAKELGFSIEWKGKKFNEKGYVKNILKKIDKECQLKQGQLIAKVDKKYFRPLDVNELKGDSSKAKKILKWKPKIKIESLIKEMVHHDFSLARNSYLIKNFNEKKE